MNQWAVCSQPSQTFWQPRKISVSNVFAIESCDDFLTFISKTEAATSNRSFVFFIVILIMCNIRMKKSFVRTITIHFVCESIAQTHRTCIWECKATIKKHHDLSKTESKGLFHPCSDFSNAEIGEIESQQYTAQTKAIAKSGEDRSVVKRFRETKKRDAIRNVS